jgi:hypothetical protein
VSFGGMLQRAGPGALRGSVTLAAVERSWEGRRCVARGPTGTVGRTDVLEPGQWWTDRGPRFAPALRLGRDS